MQHNFNELATYRCPSDLRELQHDIRHKLNSATGYLW
jgi:hypothetical protein